MVGSINSVLASTLFSSSSTDTTFGVGADLLASWAAAKAGIGAGAAAAAAQQDPNAPLAPVWNPGLTPADDKLVQNAIAGKAFFDTKAELYSALGATGDYNRLFALHVGLATLQALAGKLQDDKLSSVQRINLQTQFNRGVSELQGFFGAQKFEDIRLVQGDRVDEAQTSLAIPSTSEDYITPVIHKGSLANTVSGLDPNAKFNIIATTPGGTQRTVVIDLSQMGSIPRSLGNVVSFINGKLAATGAASRFEAVNQTPKTTTVVVGGKTIEQPYSGQRLYALKVDVRAGETIKFEPQDTDPAFYIAGAVSSGARLVKLSDVGGAGGQPVWLERPDATGQPIGADVAEGWLAGAPAGAFEVRTSRLVSDAPNNFEDKLREAGEATLKLNFPDGRVLSLTTSWRSDDLENWRQLGGESEDQGILSDLAQRFTQLLHEQGVAAGVEVWTDADGAGLSIKTGDGVTPASFTVSGRQATLTNVDPANMVGGLREGVFARRFETTPLTAPGGLFKDEQTFTFTAAGGVQTITIDGGEDGIDAVALSDALNAQLRAKNIAASAEIVDNAGVLSLRVDALHDMLDVSASINGEAYEADLQAPGAWAIGGLPVSSPGAPFADAVRTYDVSGGSPLTAYTGALDISIVVATPTGNKTVNVSVSASERANDPDPSPGHWSSTFQARLDAALNQAGVYVGALGDDLAQWSVAEGSGQRIQSITVNGDTMALSGETPAQNLGGAFSVERSFTSAQAASGVADPIAALASDQSVSISFNTIWGQRTVSASLQGGDPQTLESAALRLNEALASAGYDLGVEAVDLAEGGAGLRIVAGASHTIAAVSQVSMGGVASAVTLDPVDSLTNAADPVGTARVAARAAHGVAVTETIPASSTFAAPSVNASGWFAGRAFDVSIGGGAKVATARAVATGPDGSVYVLADIGGDADGTPIKGSRDVALFKYDSAGKLAYSRLLGASESASGFALAVSSDNKVAVAGSVTGALAGTSAKGGTDSFVTVFDSAGSELWTARRGASADDEASAIAFASDGSVIVAGKTQSALSPALAIGGADAYLRGYSASGAELFTKQFGTAGADEASALLVRDDGAGGLQIFTGGVEDNRGVVRSFSYSHAGGLGSTVGKRDIGFFYGGAINALAVDGNALYVGGEVGVDRLSVGGAARGAVAGKDGFVARIDTDLASTAIDRATYVGSAQDDAVSGLAVVNGVVYASGTAGGVLAGQSASGSKASFLTRLDDDGAMAWTRTFYTGGGAMSGVAMAVDAGGASALDVLGLPNGRISTTDSSALINRSALRPGDEFKIGIDGKRLTTITISASDTLSSLLARINTSIGSSGRAEITKDAQGASRIHIVANDGRAIALQSGRAGRDALAGLGFQEGIIAKNSGQRGAMQNFGLGLLPDDLKVTDAAAIAKAKSELAAADSIVRRAYEALVNPNAQEKTDLEKKLEAAKSQPVPAYLTAQLANYQAALARLGG
ncbi:MAG TPA: hypothetical protein VG841_01725 [Caulobacterales bacterium]|nr:hypothetical protein [Caulobacterales bacterium]